MRKNRQKRIKSTIRRQNGRHHRISDKNDIYIVYRIITKPLLRALYSPSWPHFSSFSWVFVNFSQYPRSILDPSWLHFFPFSWIFVNFSQYSRSISAPSWLHIFPVFLESCKLFAALPVHKQPLR